MAAAHRPGQRACPAPHENAQRGRGSSRSPAANLCVPRSRPGWGDIGYHLVVDEQGLVYEGRAGSATVLDGGPVVIAGHVYGHNHGNIGIAVLGTLFEDPPSPRAWSALVDVIAWLVSVHHLDAMAIEGVDGATSTTIRAHRDLRDTTCPGDALYALLPMLRAEVARRTGPPQPRASTVSPGPDIGTPRTRRRSLSS